MNVYRFNDLPAVWLPTSPKKRKHALDEAMDARILTGRGFAGMKISKRDVLLPPLGNQMATGSLEDREPGFHAA